MKQNIANNSTGAKKVLERLAEEKKKSVTALCLVTVMAFMWIRVFTGKTPQDAEATVPETEQSSTEEPHDEKHRVSFVELPKVAGRNDMIARDFFASNGWRHFVDVQGQKRDGIEKVSIASTNGNEEVIERIAKKLKLEATMMSTDPIAFIKGQVRRAGDKMLVTDGTETYECEVAKIEDNIVVIKCREAEITLKLMPVSTSDN